MIHSKTYRCFLAHVCLQTAQVRLREFLVPGLPNGTAKASRSRAGAYWAVWTWIPTNFHRTPGFLERKAFAPLETFKPAKLVPSITAEHLAMLQLSSWSYPSSIVTGRMAGPGHHTAGRKSLSNPTTRKGTQSRDIPCEADPEPAKLEQAQIGRRCYHANCNLEMLSHESYSVCGRSRKAENHWIQHCDTVVCVSSTPPRSRPVRDTSK